MKPKHTALFLIAAVIGLAAAWTFSDHREAFTLSGGGATDQDRYQQLLQMQAAQDARLDRIEAMVSQLSNATPLRTAQPAGHEVPAAHFEAPESEAQVEARREQALAQTERKFSAEPVSPGWSSKTERLIGQAFSPQNLASKGAPTPRYQEVACRSRTCRIEAVYANDQQAETGQLMLYSDIGLALNRSTPFQRTLPDGSVQLTIYAFNGGDSTAHR